VSFDVLASGFGLAEGPTVGPGGVLYVSDALLGGVRRLDPDGGERHLLAGRRGIGGLALHATGGLLASGRDVVLLDGEQVRPVLAVWDAAMLYTTSSPDARKGRNLDHDGRCTAAERHSECVRHE